jgi:hypothetical protein
MHFSTEEVLTSFRLDQYQIYLVLLTLWGYQAKREARRMKAIIDVLALLVDYGTLVFFKEYPNSSRCFP